MTLDLIERRAASFAPSTFNAEERTVEVIFSTGADVARPGYTERLSMTPDAVDLSRLIGAHVLDSHRKGSLADVIGVVISAEVRGGKGYAKIKFSERASAIISDVAAGIIRHVSIGYSVQRWADSTDQNGGRLRTAQKWTPMEISFVPVPADPGATVRTIPNMEDENLTPETPAKPATQTRAQTHEAIRSLATQSGLDADWANKLIDADATVETARAAALEAMQQRQATVRVISPQAENPDAVRAARTEALYVRTLGGTPSDAARPFMYDSILDHARAMLTLGGVSIGGLPATEILQRAHGLSDFPALLTGVGNRALLSAYEAASSPLKRIARQTNAADFRPQNRLRVGGIGRLEELSEHGEIQSTTRAEVVESYSLKTFARMFTLTRKAQINDDLSALTDFWRIAGQAAAETEAQELLAMLTMGSGQGPRLSDGERLFSAAHSNWDDAGAAINIESISAARKALRTMTDLDGESLISVVPKFLLVGPEQETAAEKFLASINPTNTNDANPFTGKLTLLVEPRISGLEWFVFGEPSLAPVMEYAYLSGAPGPQIASRDGFEVLAREFRVVLDFGVGCIGHRGAYRNDGAEPEGEG